MIAIIIVNWNGSANTLECLRSVIKLRDCSYRVFICDNGSIDDSYGAIKSWCLENECQESGIDLSFWRASDLHLWSDSSKINFVDIGYNSGFAAANNVGIKLAVSHGFEAIWLLNNDTVVHPLAACSLLDKLFSDPLMGICGSTLLYFYDSNTVQGIGVQYNLFTTVGKQILNGLSFGSLKEHKLGLPQITYVIGASMFIRPDFIKDVGLMSEEYFLFFEEIDWALRAKGRWSMGWASESIVWHKEGGSIGTSTTGRPSDRSIAFMSRSLLLFYARHRPWLLPIAIGRVSFNFSRYLWRKDWAACRAILLGLRSLRRDPRRLLSA